MLRYALTILLSAFLLFQVQPLIARYILPWFGGSPAVWTTCLLFFQMLLLLGYLYAHLVSTKLSARGQACLHAALLLLSLATLPIIPGVSWKPAGNENPAVRILLLLTCTVGVPYLLLSTTGPLVQRWFSLAKPGVSPYRLYALSNVGSLAALLTYPVLIEPFFALGTQALVWSVGYGLFALLCGTCAWQLFRLSANAGLSRPNEAEAEAASLLAAAPPGEALQPPRWSEICLWLLLAAMPSVLLLATTSQLSQEVAVVPFLWVLPLSLYLISFIIAFDSPRWYLRPLWFTWMFVSVLGVVVCLYKGIQVEFKWQILAYGSALFGCVMCCHGELAASRPVVRFLTHFYLTIAAGGALGGVLVVLVAPLVFTQYWELHIGLVGCVIVAFLAYYRSTGKELSLTFWLLNSGGIGLLMFSSVVGVKAWREAPAENRVLTQVRSFYGVMTVKRESVLQFDNQNQLLQSFGEQHSLIHGQIRHGIQLCDQEKQLWRSSYYSPQSGVGMALQYHPRRWPGATARDKTEPQSDQTLRVGVVGLGTGSLAAYGQKGDVFRFYELNPAVRRLAYKYFTYCTRTPAKVEIVLGDARIKLEQELASGGSQQYDVLAIDAFSSDSIPMHLLTRECLALYEQHLKPDGILALHISNRFLNLQPVAKTLADEAGYQPLLFAFYNVKDDPVISGSEWVLLTRNTRFIQTRAVQLRKSHWPVAPPLPRLIWTDDYGSLLQILE